MSENKRSRLIEKHMKDIKKESNRYPNVPIEDDPSYFFNGTDWEWDPSIEVVRRIRDEDRDSMRTKYQRFDGSDYLTFHERKWLEEDKTGDYIKIDQTLKEGLSLKGSDMNARGYIGELGPLVENGTITRNPTPGEWIAIKGLDGANWVDAVKLRGSEDNLVNNPLTMEEIKMLKRKRSWFWKVFNWIRCFGNLLIGFGGRLVAMTRRNE